MPSFFSFDISSENSLIHQYNITRSWCHPLYILSSHYQYTRGFKLEPTTSNISQHFATGRPNERNKLTYLALTCCDHLSFVICHLLTPTESPKKDVLIERKSLSQSQILSAKLQAGPKRQHCGHNQPKLHKTTELPIRANLLTVRVNFLSFR